MKYFGKSFFKFTLGFLAIVLASLVVMAAVSAYAAEVSKIVFVTDGQSVKPGELSGAITIQTQDSSGSALQTPETLDLEFISSSATGEFLNSSGNPTTKTMSKNTANRTFYYRDPSSGTFTLKVVATGRDSLKVWEAEQKITVSSSASNVGEQGGSGEILGANTEETSLSSTSGSSEPTYGTPSSELQVSAGGNRLTSPGSPITFQAVIKKNSSSNSSVTFSWSYGDGNVGDGALVTHMYKYPGEYAVVLNAKSGNNFGISRLKVQVAEPDVDLLDQGDRVKITNNSNTEINLFNWKIVSDGMGFVFQPDTIIFPKSSILFDKSMLKMKGEAEEGLVLKNFFGDVVASSRSSVQLKEAEKINSDFRLIQTEAVALVKVAMDRGLIQEVAPSSVAAVTPETINLGGGENLLIVEEATQQDEETYMSNDLIYQSPQKMGLFAKLTNFIKRVLSK